MFLFSLSKMSLALSLVAVAALSACVEKVPPRPILKATENDLSIAPKFIPEQNRYLMQYQQQSLSYPDDVKPAKVLSQMGTNAPPTSSTPTAKILDLYGAGQPAGEAVKNTELEEYEYLRKRYVGK